MPSEEFDQLSDSQKWIRIIQTIREAELLIDEMRQNVNR